MPKIPSPAVSAAVLVLLAAGSSLAAPAPVSAQEEPPPAASEPEAESPDRVEIEVQVEDADGREAEVTLERIPIPSLQPGDDYPYTIEVPLHWVPRRDLPLPGIVLGPPSGDPNSHPEMTLVRESDVDVSNPEAVLANLEANAANSDWTLVEGEVRDFGGVRGLWIVRKLPPAGMHGERVNLAVKVPLSQGSLDLTTTVPEERYEGVFRQQVRHVLASVRPAEDPGT